MTADAGFAWRTEPSVPAGTGYKFRDEAGTTYIPDPYSRAYTFDSFGEMSLTSRVGFGRERFFSIASHGLLPRTVRALVPAGAVTHVIYVHDGQNLFHPDDQTAFGSWHIDASVPAGVLVVGIDNTVERFDDYTHVADDFGDGAVGGNGDAYADYLEDTVRPLVRRVYGEPGPVGVMGSSLGGLISLHIGDRYPASYDFVASLSGTLGWGSFSNVGMDDGDDTILDRYRGAGRRAFSIYLDSGGDQSVCQDADNDGVDDDGLGEDNACENVQMRDLLIDEGYQLGDDLNYVFQSGAPHNEAAWADRVGAILDGFASM
jgi:hypothetical protein